MGYVHDTAMSQYIPPTALHYVTGTWTNAAGQVTGTICKHKAATAETATVTVPIMIPSSATAQHGAYLVSVELDYEIMDDDCADVAATINKVTRGADTAVAVVAAQTATQDLGHDSTAIGTDQHKMIVTLTTPIWIDNDAEVLAAFAFECAAATTLDILAAVANFTLRL